MAATVAAWMDYAFARGTVVADDAASAAALVRAGDYIKYRYVANLLPAYSADASPVAEIAEAATYIAAGYELAKPGFFSKTFTAAEQKVLTEVKGIKWTVTGDAAGTYAAMPQSTMIDAMFKPYVSNRDAVGFAFASIGL